MARSEVKLKLLCHPRIDTKLRVSDDVLLDSRDNHGIMPGDIIELRHPDHPTPTLFLVKSLREDCQHKDAISIEQSLAHSIKLHPYKTVSVKVVFKEDVLLDSVEISFRDQYYSRRDLMEFANNMTNSIVHLNTMLEYGVMRGYISELWRKGKVTSCGYVSERTKVSYRSSSAVYHIFIQMSREMWKFDEFGDLFFEKSVKFLRELILQSWTNMSCTHDVTLVLSTRVFVDAPSVKIPEKSAFSRNTDGQVYLDFYKVIVHNERYSNEEWKRNFSQLMLAFKSYEQEIKNYVLRNLPGVNDPKRISIRLSTAREANILEGLNLALSGYECYNVDRSFDRTGNACIMISPGFGVFDADREMVAFTKQRVLDLGTVVHLVCLGPQPLHAVPLFVCRDFENPNNSEVYIVPHWMNYSFFRSSREIYALNNSETVTRINVKARKAKIPGFCNCSIRWKNSRILSSKKSNSGTGSSDFDSDSYYQWKNLEKDGEREQNHNTLQINFESAKSLRERQHQRRKAITSMLSTTMPDNTHQRTVSLNEELLSASIAMVDTRSVEVGLSTPELGSFGSISSTHGWNIGAHLCSRAQSCVCSEMHSPLGGNLLLTDGFPPDALEEPSWLKLYGYSALDGGCTSAHKKALGVTNVVYGRKYSNIMDTLVHRKPQDFTHSYQSGSSYQPRGVTRLCKNTAAPVDFLACATASSWQPTGEGEVGRCQPRSILVKNGSKKPVRLTSAVAVEGFFRTFPFGIHPQLFGVHKTISQRRWGHFHTAAHRLHPIKYDQTLCMRLLEGLRPRINLAKIWHAYFSFHRYIVAALLDEAGVNARNQQQQGIENILNAFSGLPLHKSTEYHMPTTSPIADGIPSQLPLASREIDNEGSFPYGRVTIPFSDLMLKFTFSAAWRALCAAVDSPDVIQVCSQGNVDIISPGEMKSLEKALASTSEFCVGCMSGATLSPLPHHRRLLLEMLKPVGIDWKSLTTPALLPLTTDYFPETSSLLGEGYMIHEYRIVLITISDKEWNLHFDIKAFPGLAYSRHPLSGQQVLEELVSQRVAQGFQLCIEEEAAATNGTGATPLKTSDTCQSVAPSTLPSEGVSGSLTPVLPTPKRAIHSHSLAFRLRHQTAHKAGATKAKTLPAGLQERPSPSVTSQSRMAFTGGLSAASKTVHSKSKNYRLSMGSLFHSVTLQPDETITITKYQAKRTQKIENYAITYHYALQVPDGLTYHPLEITFMNRLVWAFNWSYLDNLVATQGVNESYEIVSALKFWRSRFLILPAFKDTTRRLVDSLREAKAKGRRVHCDVYETPLASIGYEKICDKFITFLESLNRIRRTSMSHRVKQFNWADAVDPQRACHDTVTPMSTVAPPSNLVRRHGTVATPTLELERAVVSEDGTHSAAATPVPPAPLAPPHSTGSLSSTSISASASPALPLSTYSEIWRVVAAILDPECGLTFITGTPLLPKHTFCAYDFTTWLSRNLVDISSVGAAVKYAQSLLNGGYICHASGNRAHKFLNGFFLYTILAEVTSSSSARGTSDLSSGRKSAGGDTETAKSSDIRKIPFPTIHLPPSSASPLGSFSTDFQKEWIEVLVVGEAPAITHPITSHPRFASTFYPSPPSSDELETHLVNGLLSTPGLGRVFGVENTSDIHVGSEGVLRKRVTRDLRDTSITTSAAAALKRHPEWYCLLYDLNYHPTCAFGLEIQWLVASASRLNEMLLLYIYYKATSPGFHIVPSPCYPFGYSGTRYSLDPLRLPIFVPCRLLQLIPAQIDSQTTPQNLSPCAFAAELFPELPEPERMIALFYFQERILSKFGFIPLSYSPAVQQQHHSHQSGGGEGFQSKRTLRSAEEPPKGMIYTQRMFVHVSGGMFAMIPLYPPPPSPAMNIENEDRLSDHSTPRRTSITVYPPSTCSYATTLCSDTDIAMSQNNCESTTTAGRRAAVDPRTSCFEAQTEVGFFWAWNHMLPRKWRGQTTGDEVFQVGMLEDFRTFCSGGDGKEFGDRRLLDTFNKFKATLGVSGGVGTPSS